MDNKICNTCHSEKEISYFPREQRNGVWYYRPKCKGCVRQTARPSRILWEKENKIQLDANKRKWYQDNKEIVKSRTSLYKKENRASYNENIRNRRKKDFSFRLRDNVRSMIQQMLKNNYGSKNGASINEYLPFTIEELKTHLEKQFEPWMNWENQGKYDVNIWNDADPITWTWQIDHIIPQTILPYASMEDDNFKKCWVLENLRPYSAKLNSIEGANRIRHQKVVV